MSVDLGLCTGEGDGVAVGVGVTVGTGVGKGSRTEVGVGDGAGVEVGAGVSVAVGSRSAHAMPVAAASARAAVMRNTRNGGVAEGITANRRDYLTPNSLKAECLYWRYEGSTKAVVPTREPRRPYHAELDVPGD